MSTNLLLGVVVGLVLVWCLLVALLFVVRPSGVSVTAVLRILPDVLRLVGRLARDPTLPRSVRMWLVLLAVYLALPFDLVPDFIPVVGLADDAIAVALILRMVVRRAGPAAVAHHWPGTSDGLAVLLRVVSA